MKTALRNLALGLICCGFQSQFSNTPAVSDQINQPTNIALTPGSSLGMSQLIDVPANAAVSLDEAVDLARAIAMRRGLNLEEYRILKVAYGDEIWRITFRRKDQNPYLSYRVVIRNGGKDSDIRLLDAPLQDLPIRH